MIKLALLLLLLITGVAGISVGTHARETKLRSVAAVGGGVAHPWRSPYKTV
jgi:hypothetical protein